LFYPLALGDQLFALFLATSWEKISAALPSGSTRFLVIASDSSAILNLPWELLLPTGGEFLGLDPLFAIRRLPESEKKLETFGGDLRPRPLRLLFMACWHQLRTSSGVPRVGPTGLPRCGGAPSTPGRLGQPAGG